jgi:hypothetical protein
LAIGWAAAMNLDTLHWLTAVGCLLILLAAMIGVAVFFLPFFEGYRTNAFLVVVVPLAAAGWVMILFQRVIR